MSDSAVPAEHRSPVPSASTSDAWLALLGRRDTPVDGVEDYCAFLASALARQGIALQTARVDWEARGWLAALRALSRDAQKWSGRWALMQYTALGWSRRGFPLGALLAVRRVQRRGVRVAVVFHEPSRQLAGTRAVDRFRGMLQDWVIHRLYARADRAIFADPLETIPWLPRDRSKAVFIPIGPNIPEAPPEFAREQTTNAAPSATRSDDRAPLNVAVYCLSPVPNRERELDDISRALDAASSTGIALRAVFLGRGTEDAEDEIRSTISRNSAAVEVLGLRDAGEISRTLENADVMLSVRGPLFPRRGSVIAGIACGLPIVAFGNGKCAFPLTEAGIELAPWHDPQAFAAAFTRLVRDANLRAALREKSRKAYRQYFSWDAIAQSFRAALAGKSGTV